MMKSLHIKILYIIFIFFILLPFFTTAQIINEDNCLLEKTDTNIVLPPAWAFGILYGGYTNQTETIKRIDEIIAHDYPIDAYWIDSWFWSYQDKGKGPKNYIDFVGDTISHPNRKAMWDYFNQKNIKSGFWTWDCILKTGNETAFNDFNEKGFFKNVYMEKGSWHNYSTTTAMYEKGNEAEGTLCGNINFENPLAVKYFKDKMKHFFDEGADFIKLDRTSAIPVCKTMFEMTQEFGLETKGRGFILSHTGGMESEEYKKYPAKWTDDTRSDWTVEKPTKDFNSWVPHIALKENIELYTHPFKPTSKIPFLTNDLGGFDMGKTDKVDEELYIRWMQFSMFTPIVEVFSQPENPTSNLAYKYSERADKLFKQYSHLRMQLFPYIYSYAFKTRFGSRQIITPIKYTLYEYYFGSEFLIAPVYEQGANIRELFLPEGKWINFWTDEIYEGNQKIVVDAPIETIPVFVKCGAIIPMRNYSRSIETGSNDTLIIHVYPDKNTEFALFEDDGISNDYLNDIYAKTTLRLKNINNDYVFNIDPVIGNYSGMNMSRTIKLIVHSQKDIKLISMDSNLIEFTKNGKIFESDYFLTKKDILTKIFIEIE
ncbi:MAG: glycoside hydrolase family 31 protein [Ignavibacteriales bacterium]|nr:glycoside hydrolase family 31 protein [Ignavibacteriales bacterium]